MLRKAMIAIAVLAVAFVIFLIFDQLPFIRRPSGVPASATRMDAKGWRIWIDCIPGSDGKPNICTMYQARTGEILHRGRYVLNGSGKGATREELRIAYYDGTAIRLKNGTKLIPAP